MNALFIIVLGGNRRSLIVVSLLYCVIVVFTIMNANAADNVQRVAGGSSTETTVSNSQAGAAPSELKPGGANLFQRFGGSFEETLNTNRFVESLPGVFVRTNILLGDAKRLLKIQHTDLQPVMSASPSDTVVKYWVDFGDARCLVVIPKGNQEPTTTGVTDNTRSVDLIINTNRLPVGRVLRPRQTSPQAPSTNSVSPSQK